MQRVKNVIKHFLFDVEKEVTLQHLEFLALHYSQKLLVMAT